MGSQAGRRCRRFQQLGSCGNVARKVLLLRWVRHGRRESVCMGGCSTRSTSLHAQPGSVASAPGPCLCQADQPAVKNSQGCRVERRCSWAQGGRCCKRSDSPIFLQCNLRLWCALRHNGNGLHSLPVSSGRRCCKRLLLERLVSQSRATAATARSNSCSRAFAGNAGRACALAAMQ